MCYCTNELQKHLQYHHYNNAIFMSDISFLCRPFIPEEPDIFDKFPQIE